MIKIEKTRFTQFIKDLMDEYDVFAPVNENEKSSYKKIKSASEIMSNLYNTDKSPKDVFFPQTETFFKYGEEGMILSGMNDRPISIWGLRNCDSKSLLMLNKVFGGARQIPNREDFQDPYWKKKYDNALLFNLACNEPLSTCFCNWFESGPFDKNGSDVFVVDIGDAFLLEPVSKKGSTYISKLVGIDKASTEDLQKLEKLKSEAESVMSILIDISSLKDKLEKIWGDAIWDEISAKCVNCAACAFMCPTCHCFDVQDEGKGEQGKRIRIWDACMFPTFTKEASGHNPRSLSKERVRQRIMHKYSYFVDNYDEFLCTGCGRCILVCPVNLDIREVIKQILDY